MNISENISHITTTGSWKLYTNKSYRAKIQKADPTAIYNTENQPGIVYNWLEDSYERVADGGYVITGIVGEMWPVGAKALAKYDIAPESITNEPQEVSTIETGILMAGIQIPAETVFTVEASYGEKAMLTGNRPGIPHGDGDYILVPVRKNGDIYEPNFEGSGRIVNGEIFDRIYKPYLNDAEENR